jgi:hypothetical protein
MAMAIKFSERKLPRKTNRESTLYGIFIRVGEKPGKFEKNHGNGKNWYLPGKMGKTAFFKIHV